MNGNSISRLNNEYRAAIYQAEDYREANEGKASAREGKCYAIAADICGELARQTTGDESRHWQDAQQECTRKAKKIYLELHPESRPDAGKTAPSPGKAAVKRSEDKGSVRQDNGDAAGEDPKKKKVLSYTGVPEADIKSWHREKPGHGLDSVIGMESTVALLNSCVQDRKMRELTDFLEIPTVSAFFFYGPPGCGKTFTIEGFIHDLMEQGFDYIKVDSGDIHASYSGQADNRLKAAFNEAIINRPSILFLDEIDGLCQSRDLPHISDFNMQLTTTCLQCFNAMITLDDQEKDVEDGEEENKEPIILIAATNYPSKVDVAMLDRFDMIPISMPNEQLREQMFRSKLKKVLPAKEFDWAYLVERSGGYSQRDINRVVANIRKKVFAELAELTASSDAPGEMAVDMLKNGEYCLRKEIITEIFDAYTPAPNTEIERSLNEFMSEN